MVRVADRGPWRYGGHDFRACALSTFRRRLYQSNFDADVVLVLIALSEGCSNPMSIRTTRKTVKFSNSFSLEGIDRILPAGNYEVVTDEELIEGLSFPVYRRVATMMLAPTQSSQAPSIEMLTIDPRELAAAMERDTLAIKGGAASAKVP